MKENLEVYKIWAPEDSIWTVWTKPVLFASMKVCVNMPLEITKCEWINNIDDNTMVILDLPGEESVLEALSLSKSGFRPVPLYNCVIGPRKSSLVDADEIADMLSSGTEILKNLTINSNALPVFMLDSNRMAGKSKEPGKFDNRWCIFPQDMPSSNFLISKGIKRIIVRTSDIAEDLKHILLRYQEQKIRIYMCNDSLDLVELEISKPSAFDDFFRRGKVIAGLTRNASGGFGAVIPLPSDRGYG